MKRRVMSTILALALTLGMSCMLTGCGDDNESNAKTDGAFGPLKPSGKPEIVEETPDTTGTTVTPAYPIDQQIALIAAKKDIWLDNMEFFGMSYGYMVTDLDQNGRLEIISCVAGGSGFFSDDTYYEVNEDCTSLVCVGQESLENSNSEGYGYVDSYDSCDVYYDADVNIYYYIMKDFLRNGMAENSTSLIPVWLKDEQMHAMSLAYEYYAYDMITETDSYTYWTISDGKGVTKQDYENAADNFYSACRKMRATFGWKYVNNEEDFAEWKTTEGMIRILTESYNEFSIK